MLKDFAKYSSEFFCVDYRSLHFFYRYLCYSQKQKQKWAK